MRILLINYMETTAPGGINKVVFEIAKNLSKRGHEIIVFNPAWKKDLEESEEMVEGFRLIRGFKFSSHLYGASFKNIGVLKELIKNFNPDIVHVHGYHNLFSPEISYIIKKTFSDIPIIFSPHLDVSRSTFVGKYFWKIYNFFVGKQLFKVVDYIISPSEFEDKILICWFSVNSGKISIIPHGVNITDVGKPQKRGDKIHLLYSGYLIKRKGVQYILKSLHSLVHEFNIENVILIIVGEGPEKKELLKLAEKLEVKDRIIWKSFLPREDFIKEFKTADIFLLLSESEAYGIVVAESLALGTPVIVTKRTALKEFLNEPGCFGVDYPPDPKEVAELILKIVNSDVKVGPFSKKIRTWGKVADDYERVYKNVIEKKGIK